MTLSKTNTWRNIYCWVYVDNFCGYTLYLELSPLRLGRVRLPLASVRNIRNVYSLTPVKCAVVSPNMTTVITPRISVAKLRCRFVLHRIEVGYTNISWNHLQQQYDCRDEHDQVDPCKNSIVRFIHVLRSKNAPYTVASATVEASWALGSVKGMRRHESCE